jgi:hypothetical protein
MLTMPAGAREERARIESEARNLARSGEHSGWWSIQLALLAQRRFTQLPYIFGNLWTCSELDRLCQEAKARREERSSKEKPRPQVRRGDRGSNRRAQD